MTDEEIIVIEELRQLVEKCKFLREEDFYSVFTIHEVQNISTVLKIIEKQQWEEESLQAENRLHKLKIAELTKENEKLSKLNEKYIEYSEIYKAQETVLKKKDKIIDEMAKAIKEDSARLETFWCNGCCDRICPYQCIEDCIKQYFENLIQEEN